MLFTAAGNYNGSYWQGTYTPVSATSLGVATLSCNAASPAQSDQYATTFDGKTLQQLTVSQTGSFPINLTWSDPPGKNASQFDLYWFDAASGVQRASFRQFWQQQPDRAERCVSGRKLPLAHRDTGHIRSGQVHQAVDWW